jgi:hypothetical protein
MKTPTCPHGHALGKDLDKHPQCDDCRMWDVCEAASGESQDVPQVSKHMFTWVRQPLWVLASSASPQAKVVYAVIASFRGKKDYSFPHQDTIARRSDMSVRNVQRCIQELVKRRWISVRYHRRRHNEYVFNDAKAAALREKWVKAEQLLRDTKRAKRAGGRPPGGQ